MNYKKGQKLYALSTDVTMYFEEVTYYPDEDYENEGLVSVLESDRMHINCYPQSHLFESKNEAYQAMIDKLEKMKHD